MEWLFYWNHGCPLFINYQPNSNFWTVISYLDRTVAKNQTETTSIADTFTIEVSICVFRCLSGQLTVKIQPQSKHVLC